MDIVYTMPGQTSRMFINIVHACPNACFFCVDFKGDAFYGFELKSGRPATTEEIIASVQQYPLLSEVEQIYFCGIGEPLLRYDVVVESATRLRRLLKHEVMLAVNTSGTFYHRNQRVDFARHFDLIQISLNAENEEKYNQICRPKFNGAYKTLMTFLHHLRHFINTSDISCRVELTAVDTGEDKYLPLVERGRSDIPKPDFEACRQIAEGFGWPLKVKKLIKDCEHQEWRQFASSLRNNREQIANTQH